MTAYTVHDDGEVEAEIPDVCTASDGRIACEVGQHDVRCRLTGPAHDLVVARCRTHTKAFTLYPRGFVPYGRVPLVELAPNGGSAESLSGETLFSAASDAAGGTIWPEAEPRLWNVGGVRTTQRRRIAQAALLLGVASMATRTRERVATTIEVPFTRLQDRSRAAESGLVIRGQAVMSTLDEVRVGARDPLVRLLAAGEVVGCWGPPRRWDSATRRLVSLSAFRSPRTRPPRAPP